MVIRFFETRGCSIFLTENIQLVFDMTSEGIIDMKGGLPPYRRFISKSPVLHAAPFGSRRRGGL